MHEYACAIAHVLSNLIRAQLIQQTVHTDII